MNNELSEKATRNANATIDASRAQYSAALKRINAPHDSLRNQLACARPDRAHIAAAIERNAKIERVRKIKNKRIVELPRKMGSRDRVTSVNIRIDG